MATAQAKTQEELINDNRVYIKETFEKLGFGEIFNQAFDKGANAGQEKIDFPKPGVLTFDPGKKERVEYMPDVVLNPKPDREGQYIVKGYDATRFAEGEKPRTHYFHVFNKTGLKAEKAHAKLIGKTVRENVIDDNGNYRARYSKLKLDEEKTPNGNYKSANVWEKTPYEIVKILKNVPLQIERGDDKDIANNLQYGETVSATMRGQVPQKVKLELDVTRKGVIVKATNEAGISNEYSFRTGKEMTLGTSQAEKQTDPDSKRESKKMTTAATKSTQKTTGGKIADNIKKLVTKGTKKTAKAVKAKPKARRA